MHDSKDQAAWKQSIRDMGMNAYEDLFDSSTFEWHVLASDFQGELITISLSTREQLDNTFQQFMMQKGIIGFNDLSTRDRLLESVDRSKRTDIPIRQRSNGSSIGTVVVGSPVARQLGVLFESESDAQSLQVKDLQEPATFTIDPVMDIQPDMMEPSPPNSPRPIDETPVEDFDTSIAKENGKLDHTNPGHDFLTMLDAAEEPDAYEKAGRLKTGLVQGEARAEATALPGSVEESGSIGDVRREEDANKTSETGTDATALPRSVEESGINDGIGDTQDASQAPETGANATTHQSPSPQPGRSSSPAPSPSSSPTPRRRFLLCGAQKTNGDIITASPGTSGAEAAMASPEPASSIPQVDADRVPASVTSAKTADVVADPGDDVEASTPAAGAFSMTAVVTDSMTALMTGDAGATADAVDADLSGLADDSLQPTANTTPRDETTPPLAPPASETPANEDTSLGEAAEQPVSSFAAEVLPDGHTSPDEAAEPPTTSAEVPVTTEVQKEEEKPDEPGAYTFTAHTESLGAEAKPEDGIASFLDAVASYEAGEASSKAEVLPELPTSPTVASHAAAASSDAAGAGQDSSRAEEASSKAEAPPELATPASLPTAPPKSGKAKKDKKKAAA